MIALSDLVDSSTGELVVDPRQKPSARLAAVMQELIPAAAVLRMQQAVLPTNAANVMAHRRYYVPLSHGGTASLVWGSSQTRVELLLDDAEQNVQVVVVTRPLHLHTLPTIPGLSLQAVTEELQLEPFELDDGSNDWRRQSLYIAVVRVGQRTVELRLIPRGSDELWLEADFDDPQPSLGDFAMLLGYASGARHDLRTDLDWLPDELRTGSIVSLQSLDGLFSLEDTTGAGVKARLVQVGTTLNFADGHRWSLIPGMDALSVSHLQTHIDIDEPLDANARYATISVTGLLTIVIPDTDDVHLPLQARWPDFAISATMLDGDKLPLGRLLQWLGLPATDPSHHEHSLEIAQLSFYAEPAGDKKSFGFAGHINNVWSFTWPSGSVDLSRIGFDLDYQEGELDVTLLADMHIDDRPMTVMADRAGSAWTFVGRLGPDANIPLGHWLGKFANAVAHVDVPQSIDSFTLNYAEFTFHSEHKDLSLKLDCSVGDKLKADLSLHLTHQADGALNQQWSGFLIFGPRRFELHFDPDGGNLLIASYSGAGHDQLSVQDIAAIGNVALPVSANVSVELRSALLVRESGTGTGKGLSLFAADFGAGLDLAKLPLLGKVLPANERLALTLQLVGANAAVPQSSIAAQIVPVNARLPVETTPLPTKGDPALRKGLNLTAKLMLAGDPIDIGLPIGTDSSGAPSDNSSVVAATPGPNPADNDDGTHWVTLQKHFGPVNVERVGLRYAKSELALLVDGGLTAGPLTLSLDGLGVRSAIQPIKPHFELHGLGLDFASGPVEIGGALLRSEQTDPVSGEKYDSFDGAAVLKAKVLSLSALGSYAKLHGHPSLFVYAVLDYPIGGPAFFFVTGLAAGFGYNRSLIMPPIAGVADYPLVKSAIEPASAVKDVAGALEQLHQYVPVDIGQYFLAVGVKFNSFKLIDSFAMLAVTFGHRFEVDVLGVSTLILPSAELQGAVTPIAELQMALKARFAPAEHLLSVEAQITSASYIFSHACHLRGGFAFYCWFPGDPALPQDGEFVVTLGGYHPDFIVPSYYPKPPRLGFSWQVTRSVQIKGDAYCALTGHAIMAGGALEATYHDGDLRAWFRASADFLLNFAPYHYEANLSVHIGASYTVHFFGTHHISVEVGADLKLHGPEFAGHARIDLSITHIDFDFGSSHSGETGKLKWPEFERAFLPAENVCSASITDGVMSSGNKDEPASIAIVNAKHFELSVNSQVPISSNLQIGPMGASHIDSSFEVTILLDGVPDNGSFTIGHAKSRKMPANLWAGAATSGKPPGVNAAQFVDAVAGLDISPAKHPTPGHTRLVSRSVFTFEEIPAAKAVAVTTLTTPNTLASTTDQVENILSDSTLRPGWEDTARALGIDTSKVSIRPGVGHDLLAAPELIFQR